MSAAVTGAPGPGALRVLQVSFFVDPQCRDPQALLAAWPSLVDIAEAAAAAGVEVHVLQPGVHEAQLQTGGVTYHFVAAPPRGVTLAGHAPVSALLARLAPQVLHVHGLGFPAQVLALRARLPAVPLLLQDHADKLPRPWRRRLWRRGLGAASALSFCALAQAEPWRRARLLPPAARVLEITESTSRFTPGERAAARHLSGLAGDPCLLWVGRLDANKDPLAVLAGVSAVSRQLPGVQLFCYYTDAPLLPQVQRRCRLDPALRERVHLIGAVPRERIEQAMRAADFFVLGSHREGSGYALLEALACGLPPLVTDIPSFRALTARGTVGALWAAGSPAAFAAALLELAAKPREALRREVRAHFERELSCAALGRKLQGAYQELHAARPAALRSPA